MTAAQVQEAFEQLVLRQQDHDTVNEVFKGVINSDTLQVSFETVDENPAPLVDAGDNEFVMTVSVQVRLRVA